MSIESRLSRLEKQRPEVPHILLGYSYGEQQPEVPPGVTASVVMDYVVLAVEPDGTEHVQDPWNPDGPPIVVRPGEPLPDRTPRGEGR